MVEQPVVDLPDVAGRQFQRGRLRLSSRCSILVPPGIGAMNGFCASSHASAICPRKCSGRLSRPTSALFSSQGSVGRIQIHEALDATRSCPDLVPLRPLARELAGCSPILGLSALPDQRWTSQPRLPHC